MIGAIRGKVIEKSESFVVIETKDGVGYRIEIYPESEIWNNLEEDHEERIWISHHVRENEETLYGFATPQDRNFFEMLTTVSGVGPKLAATLLAHIDQKALAEMIFSEDVAAISAVPGIGKKMSERLIVDLKDKVLGKIDSTKKPVKKGKSAVKHEEELELIRAGLEKLGFSSKEIDSMLEKSVGLLDDGDSVEDVMGKVLGE